MPLRRRQVLTGLGAVLGTGLAGGGLGAAGLTLRWHKTPRTTPFLTEAHLQTLAALPRGAAPRVLFVGNSFTLMHDIPAQVAALAAAEGQPLSVGMAAANGARLIETWRLPAFRAALDLGWDLLVLQDFSATALRAPDRWGSRLAMRRMARRSGARAGVLYPTWAFPPGHRTYAGGAGFGAAVPADPAAYAAAITAHYSAAAADLGWPRAPVTEAFGPGTSGTGDLGTGDLGTGAFGTGAAPYLGSDQHHLNAAGAARVAQLIWQSLAPLL